MKKPNKTLSKTLLRTIWILYALISILIWLPQVDGLLVKDLSVMSQYISLDDSWLISIDDDIYYDVSLNAFRFDTAKKGSDTITCIL